MDVPEEASVWCFLFLVSSVFGKLKICAQKNFASNCPLQKWKKTGLGPVLGNFIFSRLKELNAITGLSTLKLDVSCLVWSSGWESIVFTKTVNVMVTGTSTIWAVVISRAFVRLPLESWYTNLEQEFLNRCQQLPAHYKRLLHDLKRNQQTSTNNRRK